MRRVKDLVLHPITYEYKVQNETGINITRLIFPNGFVGRDGIVGTKDPGVFE